MSTLLADPPGGRYEDMATERLYRKQRLAAGFRLFGRFGFDEGVAGHITASDPEDPNRFWVNPFAMSFSQIKVSRPPLRRRRRDVVVGDRPRQPGGLRDPLPGARGTTRRGRRGARALGLRQVVLRARSPARSDHPGRLRLLRGPRAVRRLHRRRAHAPRRGSASRTRSGESKAVILRNHGNCYGRRARVEEAVWWFVTMERSCQAQLLAMSAGTPVLIDARVRGADALPGGLHVRRSAQLPAPARPDRRLAARPPRLTGVAPTHRRDARSRAQVALAAAASRATRSGKKPASSRCTSRPSSVRSKVAVHTICVPVPSAARTISPR